MRATARKQMYFNVPEISNHDDGAREARRNFEHPFRIDSAIDPRVRNVLTFFQ